MAEVSSGLASYASRHPCVCFRIGGVHARLPSVARQAHAFKYQLRITRSKACNLKPSATASEQPVSEQEFQDSTGVQTRSLPSILLNAADDPQASIVQEHTIPEPSPSPFGQSQGSSTNVYTKAERASLANIPESQMTPEMLRRWRISKANKGKQAWNKGRRHSPGTHLLLPNILSCLLDSMPLQNGLHLSAETLARIKEGTKAAMMRPEVLARVRANHPSLKHTSQVKVCHAHCCPSLLHHACLLCQQCCMDKIHCFCLFPEHHAT